MNPAGTIPASQQCSLRNIMLRGVMVMTRRCRYQPLLVGGGSHTGWVVMFGAASVLLRVWISYVRCVRALKWLTLKWLGWAATAVMAAAVALMLVLHLLT